MNRSILTLSVAIGVALFGMAHAAEVVPVYADGPNEGYNDNTAASPAGGNPGTTLGAQRRIVAQFAADLWGAVLVSDVPILVGAQFNPLGTNVLGSAGATFVFRDEPEFPLQDTWFSSALADALVGEDLNPGFNDIASQFSSTFAFYYGLDGNTPGGQVNFLDVVMHEYGHGLGFQNFENESTGAFLSNTQDIYSTFTFDNTTGEFWSDMTRNERKASALNYGNVVFTGANATSGAALILDDRTSLLATAPASIVGEYGFGTASFGPPATPANFGGSVVVGLDAAIPTTSPTTTDGCSPFTNAAQVAGKIAIVDRGSCTFVVKATNAQAAGATGLLVANNVAGSPAPGLGGVDPTITIPALGLTQADGALFKGTAGVVVALDVDPTRLMGADDDGRPRLFMPDPVQGGSSGSHYDSAAAPNLLMEPAINDSLHAGLTIDISAALLEDTGWHLNDGNATIAGCDTGIPIIVDGGLIVGANVQATSNLLLATSSNKGGYQSSMNAYAKRLRDAGLITGGQSDQLVACANLTGP